MNGFNYMDDYNYIRLNSLENYIESLYNDSNSYHFIREPQI